MKVLSALHGLAVKEDLAAEWGKLLAALADARVTLAADLAAGSVVDRAKALLRPRAGDPLLVGPRDGALAAIEGRIRASRSRYVQLAEYALMAVAGAVAPDAVPKETHPPRDPADRSFGLMPWSLDGYDLIEVQTLSADWSDVCRANRANLGPAPEHAAQAGAGHAEAAALAVRWADAVCLALAEELWAAGAVALIGLDQAVERVGMMELAHAAEITGRMDPHNAASVLAPMSPTRAAAVLNRMGLEAASAAVGAMDRNSAVAALDLMAPSRVAELLLAEESPVISAEILERMDPARVASMLWDAVFAESEDGYLQYACVAGVVEHMNESRRREILSRMTAIDELNGTLVAEVIWEEVIERELGRERDHRM